MTSLYHFQLTFMISQLSFIRIAEFTQEDMPTQNLVIISFLLLSYRKKLIGVGRFALPPPPHHHHLNANGRGLMLRYYGCVPREGRRVMQTDGFVGSKAGDPFRAVVVLAAALVSFGKLTEVTVVRSDVPITAPFRACEKY